MTIFYLASLIAFSIGSALSVNYGTMNLSVTGDGNEAIGDENTAGQEASSLESGTVSTTTEPIAEGDDEADKGSSELDDEEKKTRKNMTNHVYQMQGNLSSQQERRRIGFISSFFRKHSVGKLIKGIITELCKQTTYRNKYEVYVYFIGGINLNDNITKEILSSMNHANIRKFSSHETLNSVANSILDDLLDVLIYPEIGMDYLTYFLAYKRLARVQAAFWGHPVTSGIEYTMDYFITSNLFHIYNKEYEQNKFIEQLYYMNGLTTYFQKPEEVSIDKLFITNFVAKTFKTKRFRYNIDNDNFVDNQYHLYICLQTLYNILQNNGHVLFIDL